MTLLGWVCCSYLWTLNQLWECPTQKLRSLTVGGEYNNKAWMGAQSCRQTQTFIAEEQPNRWIVVLLRLSRWEELKFALLLVILK